MALAGIVGIDLGRTPGAVDRALVPGFAPDRVTELVWERAGQPALRVVRAGEGWQLRSPSAAAAGIPADPSAVSDVLAALRGARWHRRGEPVPVQATLTVVAGAARHVLGLGAPIEGTEQAWLVADGHGVVVDRWATRALDRDPLALRIKAPLAEIRSAQTIVLADDPHGLLRIDGTPWQLHAPDGFVLAADVATALEQALAAITIVRLPDGPAAAHGLAITSTGRAAIHLVLGGSCPGAPDLVAVSGTAGDGCIERAAADGVERAVGRLHQPPAAIVERRPVPFEPQRLVLADAVALDATALRVGDARADPARVAELYAALAAPAEVAALPATPATGHLVVTGHAGAPLTLDLFADHVLARHGEPVALRPAPGAWRLLVRPSRELRDVTLWLEEPTTITAVQIDDVRYQRGAIIGEWTRQPVAPGGKPVDALTLEALVALLAAPRALGFFDDPFPIVHRVTLVITPPTGAPTEHVLALGAARPAGCPARVERDAILLPAVVCTQVAALAK